MSFEIPIVIFIFKRIEKSLIVIEKIKKVAPQKLYIISDAGRNEEENKKVELCRRQVEEAVDWPCTVIKKYAVENKGCYEQIGLGALDVLEDENMAIFLEDDNLPDISFFAFCKEMLLKYEDNEDVMWICGTNYQLKSRFKNDADYTITKHMLPCGWATWSTKFRKYYDKDFSLYSDELLKHKIKNTYRSKKLFRYDMTKWQFEVERKEQGLPYSSWDHQMCFSLRAYDKYGIAPKNNLIENIGVDIDSAHGGYSYEKIMIRRFCGLPTYSLNFPLKHPRELCVDSKYERQITKIVIPPINIRKVLGKIIRKFLHIPNNVPLKNGIRKLFNNKNMSFGAKK